MKQKSDNNGTRNCRSQRSLAMRYVLIQKLWRQAGGQSVNIKQQNVSLWKILLTSFSQ